MRKYIIISTLFLLAITSMPLATSAEVNIGVNIGVPPVYVNPPVFISNPPVFVLPPELGFYVAAGVGYDLFLLNNQYYLYSGNMWYRSPYYNGPWVTIGYNMVPYGIRKHRFNRIHYYRDNYYSYYRQGRYPDRYHHYRPVYRNPGHGGYPPGHGGYPPGHGGYPPGHGKYPPGHGGYPPGHGKYPPGHGRPAPDYPHGGGGSYPPSGHGVPDSPHGGGGPGGHGGGGPGGHGGGSGGGHGGGGH